MSFLSAFTIIIDPSETRSDYPTAADRAAIYTDTWDPDVSNLSANHEETTFTVPSGISAIRVVAYGSGSQGGNTSDSEGGYCDAILSCSPGDQYKVIVPSNGDPSEGSGRGGHGCGGGAGPDSNSDGCGGAGAAVASITKPLTNGLVVAGGGGTGNGHGSGGDGFDGDDTTGTGALSDGTGGDMYRENGSRLSGGSFGQGGQSDDDGYGSVGAGSGGGAGAGGAGGDYQTPGADGQNADANTWGGLGGFNDINAPGAGGLSSGGAGGGGNGFVLDGDEIGGGGGGGHGQAQGGGGFAGGGSAYYQYGGGGGSGTIVNNFGDDYVQDKFVDPSNVVTSQGSLLDITGKAGPGRSTSVPTNRGSFGESGMVIIMW